MIFATTANFACIEDADEEEMPAVAMALFLYFRVLYGRFPQALIAAETFPHGELLEKYRMIYEHALRPTWRLAEDGCLGAHWRARNPYSSHRFPEIEVVVQRIGAEEGPSLTG